MILSSYNVNKIIIELHQGNTHQILSFKTNFGSSEDGQECRPFQYSPSFVFDEITTKATIMGAPPPDPRLQFSPFTTGFVKVSFGTLDHEF